MRVEWILAVLPVYSQVASPPEFQSDTSFHKDRAAATVDGTSHASAEQTRVHEELLSRLRRLPGHEEGVRLIDGKMLGAAEELFRKRRLPIGVAVSQFLSGKAEPSGTGLLAATRSLSVLPFLGETVGAAPGLAKQMLGAIREIAVANPENADATYYLARALTKQAAFSSAEAADLLRKAADLDSSDTRALLELGRLYTGEAKRADAIAAFESVLRRDPINSAAHFRLASLYRVTGQPEKARAHMTEFQKLRPAQRP